MNGQPAASDLDRLEKLIHEQERVFLSRTHNSRRLRQACLDVLPGGVASNWQDISPAPVWIEEGKGSHIIDVDGNDYVDLHGGFGANLVGHAHPAIVDAVTQRVRKGTHFALPTTDVVTVARELTRRFGLPMWRYNNSGTEATMDAVHLMRVASGRQKIIKVEGTYHGHHDSVEVSIMPEREEAGPADRPYGVPDGTAVPSALLHLTIIVPFGDLSAVERVLIENRGEIAGMIIEPLMMNIGLIPPPRGYLAALKTMLYKHGAYLCFDEVKTGLALAPGGATEWSGVTPDLLCLAKGLGGGLPCGAIGGTRELMDLIATGDYEQVGTFNGNPLTMAAAVAVLTEILTDDAYRHFEDLRQVMASGAQEVMNRFQLPGHVNSYGAKGAVIFHQQLYNYRDFLGYPDQWGNAHWLFQHNGGVFLPPFGKCEQWTLSVQHTRADAELFVSNLERMAAQLRAPIPAEVVLVGRETERVA